MKKSTKNLIYTCGALAAVAAGTAFWTAKLIVNLAVNREMVKLPRRLQNKVSGGLANDPKAQSMIHLSEQAQSLETETVRITSGDGLELTGHLYHAEHPKRIVIAMHGWRSSWQLDFGCSTEFYHASDCTMLYPDQRGQNDSEGDYIGFGVLERYDCRDWIDYVVSRFGETLPIYLCGVSMGASTVLMTSGFALPDCVKGIIADCGFTSPHSIWKHILDNNLHISEKLTYPIINAICRHKAQFDGDGYSTLEALKTNTKPVLFIHGSDDNFVPIKETFQNYTACIAPKELLIVPGAGHGLSYVTDEKAYQKAVSEFFTKCETAESDENFAS